MSLSLSPLMCSCKGLLPQSSPSHLIHKEMTGITIPQQKMLWGSQCITSFFTFAPRSNSFTLDSKILKMNQEISAPGLAPLLTCFDLDKLFSKVFVSSSIKWMTHILSLGAADLPTPSAGLKLVTASPLGAPSPARLARRRRGAGRAAALPLASVPSRSPPPLLFTILSSPLRGGWGREA